MRADTEPHHAGAVRLATPAQRAALAMAFGIACYGLAAFATALPAQARFPLAIWPADGLVFGALLVLPVARWWPYLALAFVATLAADLQDGAGAAAAALTAAVGVVEPALAAAGMRRLSGGDVQIRTLSGMTAFFVNLVPVLAVISLVEAGMSWIQAGSDLHAQWTVVFISDFVSMIVVAPLILVWSRAGVDEAWASIRGRMIEAVVLIGGLAVAAHLVFRAPSVAGAAGPQLAYLCLPFLVWAALRFGLRAATLALFAFALIAYWHTMHGAGPFAVRGDEWRATLHLQAYLATMVVTTLFAAALLGEREGAARTTREWRRRHEAAILASGNLLYELDPESGHILWDGDTHAVLGVAPGEIASARQWMARVHPDDAPRLRGVRRRLLAGEIPKIDFAYRVKHGAEGWITVGVNGYAIDNPTSRRGSRRRIIGFVSDVSDQVRAEAERQALAAQLKQAEKMEAVGRLAGGIAHDFNNILGAILGYGELAQDRARSDPLLKRYVDTIVGAGNRAKSLVEQILAYSRAESGVKSTMDLAAVAAEACDLMKGSVAPGIDVRFSASHEATLVMGEPTRLHQVVMNLASNAVQAMPEGGVLEIAVTARSLASTLRTRLSVLEPGDYVVLEVKDSGEGIPPALIDRIFEPFFTTKPVGQGTGLGLALVHSIVREHGGALDVASEKGRGTTFTVWLPKPGGTVSAPTGDAGAAGGAGQAILAVDDEPEVLHALEEMLATLGYEPVGYTNSRAALEAFAADPRRFEAVISDEVMPGLTGTQLAVELRRLNPGVPIVIATGFGGAGFETRAISVGVNRVLRKPYRMAEISDAMRSVLGGAP